MQFLIGCDPEVFVRRNGQFVNAHNLIPGDKKNPHPVRNGAVQVDGMALEFNTSPAASEDEFASNVQDVLNQLCAMVPEYEVVAVPVADFTEAYLKEQPAESLVLGCDPDFNAWTGMPNERPDGNRPMRTASGHVHIGWGSGFDIENPEHLNKCRLVSREMDFYLGLPSLFYDADTRRREMYGLPGCHRPKSYGVEYRTLSNAWLKSEALMRWVYRATQHGLNQLVQGRMLSEKYGDISKIITTSNRAEAEKIIKAENLEVCYG